jgi:murein DD-endopeptidase MepM/ murein hydrolase activator NlpD
MQKSVIFGVLSLVMLACTSKSEIHQTREKVKEVPRDSAVAHTFDSYGIKIDSLEVETYRVKRNESLYVILDKFDFSPREIYSITQQVRHFVDIREIRPGQKYRTYSSADSTEGLAQMVWQTNPIDYLVFDWQKDSLQIYKAARPLKSETVATAGTIQNSLYQTVSEQGSSRLLAFKMAEIFAWQINFFGLRDGDSFNVLYNKQFIDEDFYGIGEILAAEFIHRGEKFRAYKFSHGDINGYFTESGESVQKALLKAPFKFSQRVSSHFSSSRYHPILKKRMPHYGVDFAAPHGTPVLAVGDGTVTEAQYRGANGNIVKVTHNKTYRTAYLHLSGFADGIYRGAKVKQGQIIGYVGNTGRSTGTHLDYRLYRNNKPVNPLTVDLPSSKSVPDSLMDEFLTVRDELNYKLKIKTDTLQEESNPVLTANQ